MYIKQVDKSHYSFSNYVSKNRWASIWHQLNEVIKLYPDTVLELGPGPGIFKVLLSHFGITVATLDLDPELEPDYIGSATELPFADNTYDCVCAFQMLEHLPYDKSLQAFREMGRIAIKNLVLSLPDSKQKYEYSFDIPKVGKRTIRIPKPGIKEHVFDGEHYWEINKKGFPLKKILNDFSQQKFSLTYTYRVPEMPYHRFFVYSRKA